MTLKDNLLRTGYLPENVPPSFSTENLADFFLSNPPKGLLSRADNAVRQARYNASKRGMTRRAFSVIHPITAHDLAEFVSDRWETITAFYAKSGFSLSAPEPNEDSNRAVDISTYMEVETAKLSRLAHYRFIATTDISRFYHSLYTHAISWAFHGKAEAKADRNPHSKEIFFNRADYILRCGQDGQTMGIPVGPDASRVLAEVVGTAIDMAFQRRCDVADCAVLRHVDDVWIGANSHADAERALSRYREAIREFELDINESKTAIYSDAFKFADYWPSSISSKFEFAINSDRRLVPERLRSAFENAFSIVRNTNDDAILKYSIRFLDKSSLHWEHWDTVEPFLKRCAVHYGHSIDYVSRVIVWRHLVHSDIDMSIWSNIILSIVDRHARLGNDSEVCWGLYTCMMLGIKINPDISKNVVNNCGAMSVISALVCAELGLIGSEVFDQAMGLISSEAQNGTYWPVFVEWCTRGWPHSGSIDLRDPVLSVLVAKNVRLVFEQRLPPVFADVDEGDFGTVTEAIERRVSSYDDEDDEDGEDPDADPF